MKRTLILAVCIALACACVPTPDERVFSDDMDLFLVEDSEWAYTSGQLVLGEPVENAYVSLKLANSYDRKVVVSVAEQYGVYLRDSVFRLSAGPSISELLIPLQGIVAEDAPSQIPLNVSIRFDDKKTLSKVVSFATRENPPFEFLLNADNSVKLEGSEHFRKDDYAYFVLGESYDSEQSQAWFEYRYQNGFGRDVALVSYDIEKVSKEWDADPVMTVELASGKLAKGASQSGIRMILKGNCASRTAFVVKNIVLNVAGTEYKTEGDVLVFPPVKFRIFDMMYTHNVAGYETNPVIGYDTLHVVGTDNVQRVWIDQPLGSTDNVKVSPYYYQWGRKEDGHQWSKSAMAGPGASATNDPSQEAEFAGKFIKATTNKVSWQGSPDVGDNMWNNLQGQNGGPCNPCPPGYRVPTAEEMDPAGLNLMAGFNPVMGSGRRAGATGAIGAKTQIWTCTPHSTNAAQACAFIYDTPPALNYTIVRASGVAIRCINIPESEK